MPTTGDYNSFWIVGRWFENRTSLITNPANGKLPAITADAKKRQAEQSRAPARLHPFDGPEDIALGERCITGNVPMIGAGYNNYYQIVQSPTARRRQHGDAARHPDDPDYRPSASPEQRQLWLGDPSATGKATRSLSTPPTSAGDAALGRGGSSEKLHMIEKFSSRRSRCAEVRSHHQRSGHLRCSRGPRCCI